MGVEQTYNRLRGLPGGDHDKPLVMPPQYAKAKPKAEPKAAAAEEPPAVKTRKKRKEK